eukprot:NODE_12229_length_179_cov_1.976923_g12146_i0.p4 GENE.NODE_12229_length_179_cov_1.976923_g12146_i0~~NODE_12229_length_179_cov_1.976923_g12146_i0.p4  ORF type:complete len:50 (-),score=12.46 NODE_12229_length_179_cov_1.976923_g12146_i0:5-154(-)
MFSVVVVLGQKDFAGPPTLEDAGAGRDTSEKKDIYIFALHLSNTPCTLR